MKKTLLIFAWVLCFLTAKDTFAQTITVRGKVTEGNEPLPGVSVLVKGTSEGTSTDADGGFSLNVPGNSMLVISSIGFITQEIAVNNRTFISVNLQPDRKELEEVVVVGYGEQKKLTVTGAITSVSGEDLVKAPVAGISNALIGMSSGLQAVQNSGEFGADKATIYIRGMATLNGSGRSPLILIDGVERETYNTLDPNEIESINILKDASSTAVFGVRGANGVILITTKQGKIGPPAVNFTANTAAIQPTVLPDYVGSYEYAILRNEASENSGKTPAFTEEDIRLYKTGEDPIFHPSKNWIDEMIKPFSFQQSYNANISGGTEKLRYFTSLGYFNQSGGYQEPEQGLGFPYKHSYDKYNVRMNFDFNPVKDLSISIKLGNQITDNSIPNGGAWGALDKAANRPPMTSPAFVDGKYIERVEGLPAGVPNFNPWGQAGPTSTNGAFTTNDYSSTVNTNLLIKYNLDKVTPGLSVRAMGAYDSYYLKRQVINKGENFPAWTIIKDDNAPQGYVMFQSSEAGPYTSASESVGDANKWRKLYTEAAFDYKRTFGGAHNITGLILGQFERAVDPNLEYKLPHTYLGLVSRVTYDYKNRYLSEFNMGYNGSENFPEGKRFGFFPSVSLGWVASNEPFFPENEFFSFLKIRGSYGEVGNDKIGGSRYLYLNGPYSLVSSPYQQVVFGEAGTNMASYQMYWEGKLGNQDVTWERAKKLDIGTEMRFLSDRLSFTGDYFQEKRDNILWSLHTVPELVAATLPAANIGKVENHGYELELGWDDKIGSVGYWLKGAYSFARNKIIFQDEPDFEYEWMQRTGRPIDQYFGLTFEGFYNTLEELQDAPESQWATGGLKLGDMKYKDLNGDDKITTDDMGPVGYSNWPEVTYNFSGGFTWKGFDLSVLFQGTDNVSVSFSSAAAYPFTADWGGAQKWHMERWSPERYANGEKISFPRVELSPDKQHNYQPSSFWVQDASYLRLKNLELGYRFTAKALQRLGLNSMRIYVSGNNLLTWDNLKYGKDPDARELWGRVYPPMRVFNGGVNFQF